MSEREGTADDFAATLAGASSTPPADSSTPAEPTPEQEADAAWARALFGPKRDSFLAAAFGLEQAEPVHHEEPPQGEPPPDFDGGVREPFIETDPVADHNEFVIDLLRNAPGGGQW